MFVFFSIPIIFIVLGLLVCLPGGQPYGQGVRPADGAGRADRARVLARATLLPHAAVDSARRRAIVPSGEGDGTAT